MKETQLNADPSQPPSRIARRRAAALAIGGEAYAERRAEIIRAAAQVFRDKGFGGAGLAEVADRLGIDRASLYYYISSKEEAFHEIVRDATASNAHRAEEIRDGQGRVPDKIQQLIVSLMESYASHPYLFVYIQEDLSRVSDGKSKWSREMSAINKRYDDAVVEIVQAGLDDGSIRPVGSARIIANAIIGMVNWSHRWYRADASAMPSGAEIGQTFADSILHGLEATKKRVR